MMDRTTRGTVRRTDVGGERRALRKAAVSILRAMRRGLVISRKKMLNRYVVATDRMARCAATDGISWLFVATFPNGGSTALAQLLSTGTAVVKLHPSGEGQWLVPELSDDTRRWDPRLNLDYGMIRAVWLRQVQKHARRPCMVVEKSPPNIVRMHQLMATFSDMPTALVRFTRDPYAVCSSWATRYGPRIIAKEWGENTAEMDPSGPLFFRALGEIYGRRATFLAGLAESAIVDISYEELTADTARVLERLCEVQPLLEDVRADAMLRVKDYKPQRLRNMNQRQIGKLTAEQLAAITSGLRPFEEAVAALGYALR